MKAWVAEAACEPESLVLREIPESNVPAAGVKVRTAFAAVNFADGLMVRGRYQVRPPAPYVPGFEVSGTVVAAGANSRLSPGERVCGQIPWGAYAEYVSAPDEHWIRVPENVDMKAAAAFPVSYLTAHLALYDRARFLPGESILVFAAAGGLGLATLQLARSVAGSLIGLVGSDEKKTVALANGATSVYNYKTEDWLGQTMIATAGRGVDVVLDPVGGGSTLASLKAMAWRGRLVVLGFASGTPAAISANQLLIRSLSVHGVFWDRSQDGRLLATVRDDLTNRWENGELSPVVSAVYPFTQLPAAIRTLESGTAFGKLVVEVP